MPKLSGSSVLITGGATGIGRAVVHHFVEEGARLCVLCVNDEQASSLRGEFGAEVETVIGDVRSLADNQRAAALAVERFGGLNTFIGNAGIWDFITPLEAQDEEKLERVCDDIFGVNVKGYALGAFACLPALRQSKGSIIFTASSSSFFTGGGGPLYVASKHAVIGLIKQLAKEVAPDVRVNGVAPGGTITNLSGSPSSEHAKSQMAEIPEIDKLIEGMTPLGFAAKPEDHVALYALLACPVSARYVTGTTILSDGGIGVG